MATRSFVALLLAMALATAAGCGSGDAGEKTVVLYGFSTMEEVMKSDIIPAFRRHWNESTGQDVRIVTSFASSGTITNQIAFGAPAQIAMLATEMDAVNIEKAGLISTDWRDFRDRGTYAYTIACIVRKDNPKGLYSFEDAGREGGGRGLPRSNYLRGRPVGDSGALRFLPQDRWRRRQGTGP